MMGRLKAKDSTAKSGKTVFFILMVSSVQNWILLDDLDIKVHCPGPDESYALDFGKFP
jgi:hypothetical protein